VLVFDRVRSKDASFNKEWLLHTQNLPTTLSDGTTQVLEGNGKLLLTRLYPSDSNMTYFGGVDKEFFTGGINWQVDSTVYSSYKYLGNYRIVLAPKTLQKQDYFLNFIQVGNKNTLNQVKPQTIEESDRFITKFDANGKTYEITLYKAQKTGHIKITQAGLKVYERDFTNTIQSQAGLNGNG
jgi:hypothetical protein